MQSAVYYSVNCLVSVMLYTVYTVFSLVEQLVTTFNQKQRYKRSAVDYSCRSAHFCGKQGQWNVHSKVELTSVIRHTGFCKVKQYNGLTLHKPFHFVGTLCR